MKHTKTRSTKKTRSKTGGLSLALILCGVFLLLLGAAVLILMPKPEKMPSLINEDRDEAVRALKQLGAVVSIAWQGEEPDTEEDAAGIVVAQSIEAGELIFEGTQITLTIAQGEPVENENAQSAEPTPTPAEPTPTPEEPTPTPTPVAIPDEEQFIKGQEGTQHTQPGGGPSAPRPTANPGGTGETGGGDEKPESPTVPDIPQIEPGTDTPDGGDTTDGDTPTGDIPSGDTTDGDTIGTNAPDGDAAGGNGEETAVPEVEEPPAPAE